MLYPNKYRTSSVETIEFCIGVILHETEIAWMIRKI